MDDNTQQQQNQDNSKDAKRFEANLQKLINLFNGNQKAFKNPKVPNDQLADLADEILKEDREEVIKRFKDKTRNLMKKKAEFDKFVKQKQQEMEKAILEKKKEFSKEMEDMFQEIEDSNALANSVASTLREFTQGSNNETINPE